LLRDLKRVKHLVASFQYLVKVEVGAIYSVTLKQDLTQIVLADVVALLEGLLRALLIKVRCHFQRDL